MSRCLNILVEGPTELEFVFSVLYPYFLARGISNIRPISIETSPGYKGGDVRYQARYKFNILRLLSGGEDMIVTSLIDYYRIRNDFPNYNESRNLVLPQDRVASIEQGCAADIQDERFIPYIQLHEFEGILFSSSDGFLNLFPDLSDQLRNQLVAIVNTYPNPEMINDSPNSAPSKRLKAIIPGYRKPLYGNMIALENGIEVILEKCPRFNNWINTLTNRMQA